MDKLLMFPTHIHMQNDKYVPVLRIIRLPMREAYVPLKVGQFLQGKHLELDLMRLHNRKRNTTK